MLIAIKIYLSMSFSNTTSSSRGRRPETANCSSRDIVGTPGPSYLESEQPII